MSKARRAKESNYPRKILFAILLLIILISAILALNPEVQTAITNIYGINLNEYDAGNYVKDAFTQNSTKYLPIVIGSTSEIVPKQQVVGEMYNSGLTPVNFSSNTMATGVKVDTLENGTYTVLIYGDVNGDGRVNILDAQSIMKQVLRPKENLITGANRIAANVDEPNNEELNILDAQRIMQFILGKNKIIDTLPTSDIKNDKEKPIITLDEGTEKQEIRVSTTEKPVKYDPLVGVTVKDNVDYNIKSRLKVTGEVNVNKPGTYILKYNVTDSNGNKANEVRREVEVKNYVVGIQIDPDGMPTKTDFAKGEKISLEGLRAKAIMAYDDKTTRIIPIDEIKCTPEYADTNSTTTEKQKLTLEYQGVTTTIDITVTPHVPIFKIDGKFADSVALNETYTAPKVTAVDDEDETIECPVTAEITSIAPDGTTIGPEDCTGDNIKTTEEKISEMIKTNINIVDVGTKYEIKYTATKQTGTSGAIGNTDTLIKVVEVVDIIENVELTSTSALKKTDYINNETINLEGITAVAHWRSGKPNTEISYRDLTAYSGTNTEPNIAKYSETGVRQTLRITYKTVHPVTKENIEYSIGNQFINVKKQLETVINLKNETVVGEIYDDILIATVKGSTSEEEISANKIDIEFEAIDGTVTTNKFKKDIRKEDAVDDNGEKVVNIYATVTERGSFKVTVKPYTEKLALEGKYEPVGEIQSAEIILTSRITGKPTAMEIGEFTLDGKIINANTKIKTGDAITADIIYSHLYENKRLGWTDLVEVDPIAKSQYPGLNVTFKEFSGIGTGAIELGDLDNTQIAYELLTDEGYDAIALNGRISQIRVKALKDLNTEPTSPTFVRVTMNINNDIGNQRMITIYNASKYEITLGTTDKTTAKLRMEDSVYSQQASDYTIKQLDNVGPYYTMIPISLKDQYSSSLPITKDMLGKALADGGIEISHYDNAGNPTDLLDFKAIMGVGNTFAEPDDETGTINYIGIAIKANIETSAELDRLENGTIRIDYGEGNTTIKTVHINKIQAITPPVTKLTVTQVQTEKNVICFTPIKIADIQSKKEISRLRTGQIGIKVTTSDGNTYTIDNAGTYKEIPNQNYGFIEEETSSGVIELKFWTKKPGTYTVTPYIKNVPNSNGDAITKIKAKHDYSVSYAVFAPTKANPNGTNKKSCNVGDSVVDIEFYHEYDKENVILLEDIPASNIRYDKLTFQDKDWRAASLDDNNVEIGAGSEKPINKLLIHIGDDVELGSKLDFNIVETSTGKVLSTISIIVTEGEETTAVKVGTQTETQWMTIYQSTPAGAELVSTDEDGTLYKLGNTYIYKIADLYYTLTPINKVGNEVGSTLTEEFINDRDRNKDKPGNVSFIDKAQGAGSSRNKIMLRGFTNINGKIKLATSAEDEIHYIGIGITDKNIAELEQNVENIGDQAVIMSVDVYYTPLDSSSAIWQQIIHITL